MKIDATSIVLVGAPCITFSRSGFSMLVLCMFIFGFLCGRYGKQEGFSNLEIKKVHDTSTKVQKKTDVSVHENVPQFQEAGLILILKQAYSYHDAGLLR